jgi:hypothetical protein
VQNERGELFVKRESNRTSFFYVTNATRPALPL